MPTEIDTHEYNRQEAINRAGNTVAILLVMVLIFLAVALVFVNVPNNNESTLNTLVTLIVNQITLVIGYYFGSSSTTKKSAETIDKLVDTATAVRESTLPKLSDKFVRLQELLEKKKTGAWTEAEAIEFEALRVELML